MTTVRHKYLKAMGIQSWVLRQQVSPVADTAEAVAAETLPPAELESVSAATQQSGIANMDWSALRQTVQTCFRCGLSSSRTQTVFGVGDTKAHWLVIGEAPGADEDRMGEPFVGRAGQLLNEMLLAVGLKREQVYIANILKCRPPNNRDPRAEEVQQCEAYLRRQVELIKPRVIVAVGRIAAQNLLKTETNVGKLRKQRHEYEGIPLVVTYHPAYLLRSPKEKRKAWQDLLFARSIYREA